jgi:hypothetical protein
MKKPPAETGRWLPAPLKTEKKPSIPYASKQLPDRSVGSWFAGRRHNL